MNVDQILRQVGNELRYAPAIRAHREDLREVLQRQWEKVGAMERWPFLQRSTPLWSFPDLSIATGSVVRTGDHLLTINESELRGGAMYPTADVGAFQDMQRHLIGATVEIDADKRDLGNGNWESQPFVIERVVPASTGPVFIYLDPTAAITAWTGAEGSLRIKFPRVLLPADLSVVLSLKTESGLPLRAMMPGEIRKAYLTPIPSSGTPSWFVEDMSHEPRFSPYVLPGLSAGVGTVNVNQNHDVFSRENMTIHETIVGALAAGGSLTVGTRYRAFVSWAYAGRFGPPSNIVEVTPTTGNQTVALSNLPAMPAVDYGRTLAVFISEGEGAFKLSTFELIATATTSSVASMPTGGLAMRPARWDEVYPGGAYQYLRILPRPPKAERLVLEYQARPRRLIEGADEPQELPEQVHPVLVWLTCMDLIGRDIDKAFHDRCRENARELLGQLHSMFFPSDRYASVKGPTQYAGGGDQHASFLANFFGRGINLG